MPPAADIMKTSVFQQCNIRRRLTQQQLNLKKIELVQLLSVKQCKHTNQLGHQFCQTIFLTTVYRYFVCLVSDYFVDCS